MLITQRSLMGTRCAPLLCVVNSGRKVLNMGTSAVKRGPTAERVGRSVQELRQRRGLSHRALAERTRQIGRPIQPTGIVKIEAGERRVDVDDLVALAIAFDVTPNRLLLGEAGDAEQLSLTETAGASAAAVWRWACGESPLRRDLWADVPADIDLDRVHRFRSENRPHDPPEMTTLAEVGDHREIWEAARRALEAASDAGFGPAVVTVIVNTLATVTEMMPALEAQEENK